VTSAARSDALPELPTVSETVPGYEATFWVGVGGPKGLPAGMIELLNREIDAILADPAFKARLVALGGTTLAGSPAQFGKLIADETEKWVRVVKYAGIKLD
jgi:tripartite-type tricarboxylate transporter receptor subunit TctC